ncbi:hypothetical protein CN606_17765 [Bacillus toyonensis]|nr:hypothetical protein CN606_17765 [Bacillus toyonensis]
MKRTCNGCKALIDDSFCGFLCSLGYSIHIVSYEYIPISAKPKSQCPKPITLKEYNKIQK